MHMGGAGNAVQVKLSKTCRTGGTERVPVLVSSSTMLELLEGCY